MITWFYSFSGCTYLQWNVGCRGRGSSKCPRWLETAFSHLAEAQLWSREELCEVCVLRDKVPMMS